MCICVFVLVGVGVRVRVRVCERVRNKKIVQIYVHTSVHACKKSHINEPESHAPTMTTSDICLQWFFCTPSPQSQLGLICVHLFSISTCPVNSQWVLLHTYPRVPVPPPAQARNRTTCTYIYIYIYIYIHILHHWRIDSCVDPIDQNTPPKNGLFAPSISTDRPWLTDLSFDQWIGLDNYMCVGTIPHNLWDHWILCGWLSGTILHHCLGTIGQFVRSFSHFLFLRHRIMCWPGPLPKG